MKQEKYDVEKADARFVYWFYSEGPKGRIRKTIQFQYSSQYGRNFFNLAFGDFDESTGKMDDRVTSDNSDYLKVLNTIAGAVLDFVNFWPAAIIQIQGSTPSRTRLYQMGISSFWEEISQEFEIMGEVGDNWVPFKRGVNFKRFLVFKKIR